MLRSKSSMYMWREIGVNIPLRESISTISKCTQITILGLPKGVVFYTVVTWYCVNSSSLSCEGVSPETGKRY